MKIKTAVTLLIISNFKFSIANINNIIQINADDFGKSITPGQTIGTYNNMAIFNLGERLVEQNSQGQLVASLAKSWKVSNNLKMFKFQLEDRHKFCDGTPVTAQWVRKSFQNYLINAKNSRLYPYIKDLKKNYSSKF